MPHPQFTAIKRSSVYPTIDPSRPELSVKGKTLYVVGASPNSIGAGIAAQFVSAGIAKIGIFGRTESKLQETKADLLKINPDLAVFIHVMDVCDEQSVGVASHWARVEIGAWDVFLTTANFHSPTPTTIQGAEPADWWKCFENTCLSISHFTKSFMPKARPNATYLSLNSDTVFSRPSGLPKMAAYTASKLAAAKLEEYLAVENPNLRTFTLHPGIYKTGLFDEWVKTLGYDSNSKADDLSLAGGFCIWLCSPESEFLRGRYLSATFDVDELIKRKDEFEKDQGLLRIGWGGTFAET